MYSVSLVVALCRISGLALMHIRRKVSLMAASAAISSSLRNSSLDPPSTRKFSRLLFSIRLKHLLINSTTKSAKLAVISTSSSLTWMAGMVADTAILSRRSLMHTKMSVLLQMSLTSMAGSKLCRSWTLRPGKFLTRGPETADTA